MNKHTPGPWEYGVATNYEGFYIAPFGTLPTLAGVERFGQKLTVSCFNFPGETEANARLIAAAPELLEVCEAVLRALNSHQAYDKDMRPELRVVIAKATGK